MDLFHIIDEAQAVVLNKGVFKQVRVYRRAEEIYVESGKGFVKCYASGGVSTPNGRWIDIDSDFIILAPGKAPKFDKEKWEVESRVKLQEAHQEEMTDFFKNKLLNEYNKSNAIKRRKNANTIHKPGRTKKLTKSN